MTREQLLGRHPIWLVTLTLGGHVWRVSSEPCAPIDANGDAIPFDGGLDEMELEDVAEALALDPTPPEAYVAITLSEDLAELVELGEALYAATCEVALWVEDLAFEDRMVLVEGAVDEPQYGRQGEQLRFAISPLLEADTTPLIDPRAVISAETWSTPPAESLGQVYPFVVGQPGIYVDELGANQVVPASPALIANYSGGMVLLISGAEARAGQVRIYDPEGGYDTLAVVNGQDELGRTIAWVEPDLLSPGSCDYAAEQFFCAWTSSLSAQGLETVSDVLLRVLTRSSLPIDRAQIAAIAPRFSAWRLAGWSQDLTATPWGWISENVLPLLPVSVVLGPSGLRILPWRFDASADEAVAHLVEGEGVTRTSLVTYTSTAGVVNRVSMAAAQDGDGDYHYTRIHGPDPSEGPSSYQAQTSKTLFGVRSGPAEQTSIVWDRATVDLILSWKARFAALPAREVEYQAGPDMAWLRPGDVVLLTDDGLHLARRVALVQTVSRSLSATGLALLLYQDPARDPPGLQRAA